MLCDEIIDKKSMLTRKGIENIFIISILALYEAVSGFGEKPLKALSILILMVVIPFAVYGGLAVVETGITSSVDRERAKDVVISALHYIPFVKYSNTSSQQSALEILLAVFWQMFIALQVTLFGFSLRNKFRR